MNWLECLTIFENVAKNHSFVAAARALALPNSVITKRIQLLEAKLGSSLFTRTTRQVQLTEAGELLCKKVQPFLNEWEDIRLQLLDFKGQPQGKLNISFPPNISTTFMHTIETLRESLPKTEISLSTLHAPVKLSEHDTDLLIATEKYVLDPDRVVGISLFRFSYHCYASPAFIKRHGTPKAPSDLHRFNCLVFSSDHHWDIGNKPYPMAGLFSADSGDALVSAGMNGLGIIYIPNFVAHDALKEKKLIRLFPNLAGKEDEMKLFYVKHAYKPRKIEIATEVFKSVTFNPNNTQI